LATIYASAVLYPKRTRSNPIDAIPMDGEAIKNDMAVPVSTPAVNSPAKTGTVVQEQNGVIVPRRDATIFPPIPFILMSRAFARLIIGCVLAKRPMNEEATMSALMIAVKPQK
jgi:hypothetical protein